MILPALLVALGPACGGRREPLNVVILGVDTLRPDHMSCYGYGRETTPAIDRLAASGALFENAIAPSPWTLPSFATVFTSLYPQQHGAVDANSAMRMDFPTLASVLKANGYATGAMINAPLLKPKYGLDRGFEAYRMPPSSGRFADGTTVDALDWIDRNRDRPFFIFVHYFDPHLPYSPPAPFNKMFDAGYGGTIKEIYNPRDLPRVRRDRFAQMESLSDADWNHIKALYDGEIAFTDQSIGTLLDKLDEWGLRDNTLVVFLSDHGEEFFDHEGFEHGHTLYNELIKVPLIFSLPGDIPRNARVSRQVRLLDVAPTVLDLLDLDPQPEFEGISLRPLLEGTGPAGPQPEQILPPEIAYAEATLYFEELKSAVSYPWKLIYNTVNMESMLFNLADDPGEERNLADQGGGSLEAMEHVLLTTMFSVLDTWYVEIVGGSRDHRFDIDVRCNLEKRLTFFTAYRAFDSRHSSLDFRFLGDHAFADRSRISIGGLETSEPVTLAFTLEMPGMPVEFDFSMDGEPATDRTFIGRSLARPAVMPFIEQADDETSGQLVRARTSPKPPYIVVWLAPAGYRGDTTVDLDPETREELRSLGYIQ
jgi:arylsulfatase A-like enzyme